VGDASPLTVRGLDRDHSAVIVSRAYIRTILECSIYALSDGFEVLIISASSKIHSIRLNLYRKYEVLYQIQTIFAL
jgi:hypothetical protein